MARRPDGALERAILQVMWAADEPLTPGQIVGRLDVDLAYTTVATVLGRLHTKGFVTRLPAGRAFAYRAAMTESELAAQAIRTLLDTAKDRQAVMARFVDTMSKRETKALRAMLEDLDS